ncbi:hypothetical protein B4U84_28335 [Westiellopsis prolifica IICB1]|nr:hypothetical protein B4U84_28335 [Westiellopsis prolifica IICB1]
MQYGKAVNQSNFAEFKNPAKVCLSNYLRFITPKKFVEVLPKKYNDNHYYNTKVVKKVKFLDLHMSGFNKSRT